MTSGYVPRDLEKLCRLTVLQALNNLGNINESKKMSDSYDVGNLVEDLIRLKINESNNKNKGNDISHIFLREYYFMCKLTINCNYFRFLE